MLQINPNNGPNPFNMTAGARNRLLLAAGELYPSGLVHSAAAASLHILSRVRRCNAPAAASPPPREPPALLPPPPPWLDEAVHVDTDKGCLLLEGGAECPGELVLAVLHDALTGRLQLRPRAGVRQRAHPPHQGGEGTDLLGDEALTGPVDIDVSLEMRSGGDAVEHSSSARRPWWPSAAKAEGPSGASSSFSRRPTRENGGGPRLFLASGVGGDAELRAQAERACLESCSGDQGLAAAVAACLEQIRAAGGDGVAPSALRVGNTSAAAPSGQGPAELATAAVEALVSHGLVRCLRDGEGDPVLLASEHSQTLVHATASALPGTTHNKTEQQQQQRAEAPLWPWLDHAGAVNEPMLDGLLRRALALVDGQPGVEERVLLRLLDAVSPGAARQLLEAMVRAGHLSAVTCASSSPGPGSRRPPRLLRSSKSDLGVAAQQHQRFYFPVLGDNGGLSCSGSGVLEQLCSVLY